MGEIIILKVDDIDGSVYGKILSVLPKKIKADTLQQSVLMYGEMKIHLETKEVFLGARKVELSPYEFRLLSYLARHPGKVYSKKSDI